MQWRKALKTLVSIPERKATLGLSPALGSFLLLGESQTGATATSALTLYDESTAVSIPVNYVADAFSSIDPVIIEDGVVIKDHIVLDLLRNPSPFFTSELFFEALGKNYLVTGETFIGSIGNINRPPLEIQPLSPKDIIANRSQFGFAGSFQVSGDTLIGNYALKLNGKQARYLDGNLRELTQVRNFSTNNGSLLRGQSLLRAASREARQNILGNRHNVSLLEKGGKVSLVFHFQEDMNPDDFEIARDRVMDRFAGPDNAGSIGVTAGGKLDIKEVGTNNVDMDFAKLQDMAKQAVALTYKVPLPLISTAASTFNNYREAKLALYDDAVLPLADRIFAGLTDLLMPRYGLDPAKTKISYDEDQITALSSRRNEELKLRKELNLETTNEMRAMLGRDDVDDGNVILIPANLIPLGSDLFGAEDKLNTDDSLLRDEEE